MQKTITIIGGGLAGLTLGIGLRRSGVPVVIYELGHYPRHRVCGEFISGRGQEVLARLGLRERLIGAGAICAQTAAFFMGGVSSGARRLPAPAICISRFTLDQLLAETFCRYGGELKQGTRWAKDGPAEGIIHASGRRREARRSSWSWFGLKVHARHVALEADLEMHAGFRGYVGLCRLPGDEVNVCGLYRRKAAACSPPVGSRELLCGAPGSSLHSRLGAASFDESSLCAVAGLSLLPERAALNECRIGDCLTMIPPVTGNGMSMAFEAAELAMKPITAYAQGDISWKQAKRAVGDRCNAAFAGRLAWARWLQRMMLLPVLQRATGSILLRSEVMWRMFFSRTR